MNKTHQGTNWTRAESPATAVIVPYLRRVLMVLLLGINDYDDEFSQKVFQGDHFWKRKMYFLWMLPKL